MLIFSFSVSFPDLTKTPAPSSEMAFPAFVDTFPALSKGELKGEFSVAFDFPDFDTNFPSDLTAFGFAELRVASEPEAAQKSSDAVLIVS
jgi:hypothetical protein